MHATQQWQTMPYGLKLHLKFCGTPERSIAIMCPFRYLSVQEYFMRYKRYKFVISVPALLSAAFFVFGLVAVVIYSLDVTNGQVGSRFLISINLQTLIIYLLILALFSFFTFALLNRNRK